MTPLLVNLGGLALMAAIVWWFWLSGPDDPDSPTTHHH
jgi:plastocyanin domain-containing protein|tara:strand:- start:8251 stop:8364 length:114 start_codon:yes stop_codon:yes gene_type:complete